MKHHDDVPGMVCVELTQWEGGQLYAFLDRMVARKEPGSDREVLDGALDALGDADALAVWLRENVVLGLPLSQAEKVLELLKRSTLPEDGLSPDARAILAAVAEKLDAATASSLASSR